MTADLATLIETSPASRELSDLMLMACGWTVRTCITRRMPGARKIDWITPGGRPLRWHDAPDPTRSIDAIAELERECAAIDVTSRVWIDGAFTLCVVSPANRRHEGEAHAIHRPDDSHTAARSRCAALYRALQAAGRIPPAQTVVAKSVD